MDVQQVLRRTLVIGAGAVGKVFARTLRRAGCDVTLFVKPGHVEPLSDGFLTYELHRWRRWAERPEAPFEMVTTPEEVAEQWWDLVILAVSATALEGEWIEALLQAIGQAPVLAMQPGIDAHERVAELVPGDRLLSLMIGFIAFDAPLAGGRDVRSGLAYWFPPLSPSLMSGPEMLVEAVTTLLKVGRMPVKIVPSALAAESYAAAALMVFLAVLEAAAWRLDALDPHALEQIAAGLRESTAVVSHRLGTRAPGWARRVGPKTLGSAMRAARRLFPFDLEAYLKAHFTKVGDQTRVLMDSYVRVARDAGLPHETLAGLRAGLPSLPLQGGANG